MVYANLIKSGGRRIVRTTCCHNKCRLLGTFWLVHKRYANKGSVKGLGGQESNVPLKLR